ncbi:class I SAM-dependent methyltransferase [Aquimarina sp. RZ0]|uniref:class I SAM-dependent methyltransferase n=1 Tax=Aquimarina sp. RZ0 TaxID=2607730 RepID=UPI0011F2DA9B|nr:class I SAM-dependent methyltransferase [Aquimarina sp. RZ0]KAA1244908.1 class I SAM-dependent methyltransferase [Aquimarina sp. RZ0]
MAKNLTPVWNKIAKHAMLPETTHDERARYNFLSNLNKHLAHVSQGTKTAYDTRVVPKFKEEHGRGIQNREELKEAIEKDSHYQIWSSLRRSTMEMRQQAGRSLVLRQAAELRDKAEALNNGKSTLVLNPSVKVPDYLLAVDNHLMPGSYHTELIEGDVSPAANYDSGIFVTTAGLIGRFNDGGGKAITTWVRKNHPDFKPKRILDIGCGMGHNVLPIAKAFPDAEVIAIDTGVPMLRYGHARAIDLGYNNITFMQMDAAKTTFEDASFDWIQSTMFLHETGGKSIYKIMKEVYRLLKPGGLTLHIEQPQYTDDMSEYEKFMRDWDALNNSEPYWSKMHDIDPCELMVVSGFKKEDFMQIGAKAENDLASDTTSEEEPEDFGRSPIWNVFGAIKN